MPQCLLTAAALLAALSARAEELSVTVLNPDAAWCWFQDERALLSGDTLVAGTISSSGTVQATSFDLGSGAITVSDLHKGFAVDDHNVPGMHRLSDGTLQAFYCQHGTEPVMYTRRTRTPGSTTDWGPEIRFNAGIPDRGGFTYANPFQLSAENGRIYLFWRAIDFNPTFTWSDDGGTSWATARNHLYLKKRQRPYVKYASNGRDTIHFAYTDGHPRNQENNIYHAFYRDGQFHDSTGRVIRGVEEGPVQVAEGTRVYTATQSGKAWIWDVALAMDGSPVMVYATVPGIEDHRYRYARWNAETRTWQEQEIAFAGRGLYEKEREYSGGICLDPDDLSVVYISANVDPVTGQKTGTGRYEVYRGRTSDGGRSWTWTPLTRDSRVDNLRPVVPAGHPEGTFVLWFRGEYRDYCHFNTELVLARQGR